MKILNYVKNNRESIKQVFAISLPAVIDLLAQTMLSITDMAMVGKKGATAISSVGLGSLAFNMILPAFMSIAIGTIAIVSRAYGSKNVEEAKNSIIQSLILCIPLSFVVTFIYMFFAKDIIKIVARGSGFNLSDAINYHLIVSLGFLPLAFTVVFLFAYRGISLSKIPMYVNSASIFINIIFNYIFIFLFNLGVSGAAIATTLTRTVVLLIFVYLIFIKRKHWIALKFSEIKYDKIMIMRIIKTGIPAAIEQLSLRFGMLVFEIMVVSLGSVAYSAHKIATNAESISFNMGFAFSMAASALIGQQLGKNDFDGAKKDSLLASILCLLVMSIMGIIFLIFPVFLTSFFTDDIETKRLAARALRIVSTCQPPLAITMCLSGALRGAGDTKSVLLVSFFGIYIVRLPLTYLFINVLNMGLDGAWWVMTIDTLIRGILLYKIFNAGKWRYINV